MLCVNVPCSASSSSLTATTTIIITTTQQNSCRRLHSWFRAPVLVWKRRQCCRWQLCWGEVKKKGEQSNNLLISKNKTKNNNNTAETEAKDKRTNKRQTWPNLPFPLEWHPIIFLFGALLECLPRSMMMMMTVMTIRWIFDGISV